MLTTGRLILRPWCEEDVEPFTALNADPEVAEFLPRTLRAEESLKAYWAIQGRMIENGYDLLAVEVPGVARFVGFIGLKKVGFEAHFTPNVEIAWRLARAYWGRGYATEGARAAVRLGFEVLELPEIVAFTVPENRRSRRVMEKLGMTHNPAENFEHPLLPIGHNLRRHLLYRLSPEGSASKLDP